MAEMRRGAVTAAGNDEVDGLRRKGGISGMAGRKNEDGWAVAIPSPTMKGKVASFTR